MKPAPSHLPEWKRNELDRVCDKIRDDSSSDVAMIILYGSYARGDYKEEKDLKPGRKSGHVSDYDILVVTRTGKAAYDTVHWSDVELECRRLGLSALVRLLAHDIDFVNNRFAEGQYFFKDIRRDGCFLYNSREFTIADERELTREEKLRIAQEHYDYWFERAKGFLKIFDFIYNENVSSGNRDYGLAAFNLQQVVESAYKAVLLVLTNYCPHEHFLGVLGLSAEELDIRLEGVFPRGTRMDNERFKLFDYAYIGGRYDPKYTITEKDLDLLAGRVRHLLELTETICRERLSWLSSVNGSAEP